MVIKKRTAGLPFLSGRGGLIRTVLIAGLGLLSVFVLIGGGLAAWAVGPIVAGAPSPYEALRGVWVNVKQVTYGRGPGALPAALLEAVPRYLEAYSRAEPVPRLQIDVKFKHWRRLLGKRDQALAVGVLQTEDDDEIPATITVDGRPVRADIRLKGDLSDHFLGSTSWSLRVELEDDDRLFGMARFNLQHPRTRAYALDPLWKVHARQEGVLAPRYDFVHVVVNGNDWGLMEVEEHFSKELLEAQRRRDGVIGRFDEATMWAHVAKTGNHQDVQGRFEPYYNFRTNPFVVYQRDRLAGDPMTAGNLAAAEGLMAAVQDGRMTLGQVLDLDKFARYLVVVTLWGADHALNWHNQKFYFNPYTLKFEPIAGDGLHVHGLGPLSTVTGDMLVLELLQEPVFRERLARAIDDITGRILEGDTVERLDEERRKIEAVLHLYFPLLGEIDLAVLKSNARVLAEYGVDFFPSGPAARRSRPPLDADYVEHVMARVYETEDGPRLAIYNRLHQPVVVRRVVSLCAGDTPADAAAAAAASTPAVDLALDATLPATPIGGRPVPLQVSLPPPVAASVGAASVGAASAVAVSATAASAVDATAAEATGPEPPCPLAVVTALPGGDQVLTTAVAGPLPRLERHPFDVAVRPEALAAAHPWLTWNGSERRFETVPGRWSVDAPVILPEGADLLAPAGTTLEFGPQAYLLVQGAFEVAGTAERPVTLRPRSPGGHWRGVYVKAADRKPSRWRHARIENTEALTDGEYLALTGAVAFYDSDVTLENVVFAGTTAEDALNIIDSRIELTDVRIAATRSDAFDCDFCDGTVSRSSFSDTGGDALDVSGSRVTLADLDFERIRDKAVSVGEGSEAVVRNIRVRDVGTAVAAKDRSRAVVEQARIQKVHVAALMSYTKKQEYGPAHLEATAVSVVDAPQVAVAQTGSVIYLEGKHVNGIDIDVDKMYAEGPMKK